MSNPYLTLTKELVKAKRLINLTDPKFGGPESFERHIMHELAKTQVFIIKQLLDTEEAIAQDEIAEPQTNTEAKVESPDLGNVFTTCINNGQKAAILHLCEVMESALNEGVFASDDGGTVFKKLPEKAYFSLSFAIARVNAIVGGKK